MGGSGSASSSSPNSVPLTLSSNTGRGVLSAESILRARARGLVAEGMVGTLHGVQHPNDFLQTHNPGSWSGNSATQTDCEAQVQTESSQQSSSGGSGRRSPTALQKSMASARELVRGSSVSSVGAGSSRRSSSNSSANRPPWDSTNTMPQQALGSLKGRGRG